MDTNTTIKTVAKGDCFLCQGDDCGTLHAIAQLIEQFSYRILNINRE